MIKPTLLVLAAGMGSRYGGLKQIDPVGPNGETIIDYSIYDARRAGFGRLVFVIRKEIEAQFKEFASSRFGRQMEVEYVFQELDKLPSGFPVPPGRVKPWGTAHAVLMAADTVREPFAVINADDFYGPQSYRLLARHLQSGSAEDAMVGFILRNTLSDFGTVARGICQVDEKDCLQSVVELTKIERDGDGAKNTAASGHITKLNGNEIVSMNFWGFAPTIFGRLKARFDEFLKDHGSDLKSECYIPSAVNEFIKDRQLRMKVLRTNDSWFGVTYRDDRPRVVASIRKLTTGGEYPEKLWRNP
jgi:UTP-glucose-1-phosphate uridylyltransferase